MRYNPTHYALVFRRIMQSEINMFILNMAVADLIASLVLPPTFLVTNVFQAYMLGPWWCKFGGTVRCKYTTKYNLICKYQFHVMAQCFAS